MRRVRWLQIAIAPLVIGAVVTPLVVRNDRSAFTIDHTQPFRLEFGRGSGWHGLDTVKIDHTGRVLLHRRTSELKAGVIFDSFEHAALQLSPEMLAEVLTAVASNNLSGLNTVYRPFIHINDGTQWVLWIKQGEWEKSVYFDNRFPNAITAFAGQLDAILTRAGSEKVSWQPVPAEESGQHERELWDSIKQ